MKFEELNLNKRVLDAVTALGYTTPTPIQEQAIPVALEGRDLMGLAQTGTGKTAAFVLPILERLLTGPLGPVRALIIAPTRELAQQIHEATVDMAKYTKIRSVAIYGGVNKNPQVKALRRGAEIVVACPGRLLDHVRDGSIDLSKVEVLVLDEADTMCDMGFLPDIRRILTYVRNRDQTLFFAATMSDEIRGLSRDMLTDPTTVQIGVIAPAETVSHTLYPVTEGLKKRVLLDILQNVATGRVMVFTRTKHRTRRLAGDLENYKYRVAMLQGNMAQNKRQQSINGFRDGKYDILVATDVASRGIDVSQVSHVINFDMPNTVDAYIHRIGRTGRAEQTGEALTLTLHEDAALVRKIEDVLGGRIERRRLPDFDYGGFIPDIEAPRSRSKSRRQAPPQPQRQTQRKAPAPRSRYGRQAQVDSPHDPRQDSRPAVKSAPLRPDDQNSPNGPRRRRPRRQLSPAPVANPAQ
ncbi:MAG: DEAD/DEAH box helicase [Chloroflexi bacterium]|nr:DEAD/DEAH box helicase [Chloroflexota bacterium]